MGAAGGGRKHGDWQWHWIEHVPRPFRTMERFAGGVALLAGANAVAYFLIVQRLAPGQALLAGALTAFGVGLVLWVLLRNMPGFDIK